MNDSYHGRGIKPGAVNRGVAGRPQQLWSRPDNDDNKTAYGAAAALTTHFCVQDDFCGKTNVPKCLCYMDGVHCRGCTFNRTMMWGALRCCVVRMVCGYEAV